MKRLFYVIFLLLFISCSNTDDAYEASKKQTKQLSDLFDNYFNYRNNNDINKLKEIVYIYKFPQKTYLNLNDPQFSSIHKINFTNWKIESISEILVKHSEKYCLIGYSAKGTVEINENLRSIQDHIESINFNYNLNIEYNVDSINGYINCEIKDSLYAIQPYNDDNWYIYEEFIDIEDSDLEIISSEVIDYLEYNIKDNTELSPNQNIEIGTKYYERGYYRAALEYFNKYAEGLMIYPQLAYKLGYCYSKTNEYLLSNKFFNISLENNHRTGDCYYFLAKNQINLDKTVASVDTALKFINKAIEIEPDNYDNYGFKGELYLMIGDKKNACDCFEEAIKKGGEQYSFYLEQYCNSKKI